MQGQFWSFHDRLFVNPSSFLDSDLLSTARSLGLDLHAFESCRQLPTTRVSQDVSMADALQLGSTPSFLVGYLLPSGQVKATAVINGAQPIATFAAAIDGALKQKR